VRHRRAIRPFDGAEDIGQAEEEEQPEVNAAVASGVPSIAAQQPANANANAQVLPFFPAAGSFGTGAGFAHVQGQAQANVMVAVSVGGRPFRPLQQQQQPQPQQQQHEHPEMHDDQHAENDEDGEALSESVGLFVDKEQILAEVEGDGQVDALLDEEDQHEEEEDMSDFPYTTHPLE